MSEDRYRNMPSALKPNRDTIKRIKEDERPMHQILEDCGVERNTPDGTPMTEFDSDEDKKVFVSERRESGVRKPRSFGEICDELSNKRPDTSHAEKIAQEREEQGKEQGRER